MESEPNIVLLPGDTAVTTVKQIQLLLFPWVSMSVYLIACFLKDPLLLLLKSVRVSQTRLLCPNTQRA